MPARLTILAIALLTAPAFAEDPLPPTLTIQTTLMGGVEDDEGAAKGGMRVSFPLDHDLRMQIEGALGTDDYAGGAAHIAWRGISNVTLGAVASVENFDGFALVRAGLEAEVALGAFAISLRGGWQGLEGDDSIFGRADLYWYPLDTLALTAGVEAGEDVLLGRLRGEWQPLFADYPELTLFVAGEFAEEDRYSLFAGVSVELGTEGLTLRRREREVYLPYAVFNQVAFREFAVANGVAFAAPPPLDCQAIFDSGVNIIPTECIEVARVQ